MPHVPFMKMKCKTRQDQSKIRGRCSWVLENRHTFSNHLGISTPYNAMVDGGDFRKWLFYFGQFMQVRKRSFYGHSRPQLCFVLYFA